MKDIDVLCVGVTSYDLIFKVDHHPQANEKSSASALISCGGGPAANAALTVAKLGLKAAFSGYLGNDILGDLNFKEFQSAGINTDFLVRGKEPAPLSVVLVKPDGDRTLVNYRSSKPLQKTALDFSMVNPKVILFDGHEPEISLILLQKAARNKIPAILDAGSLNKGTSLLFDKVDYLVCSESFAQELTGKESQEALKILREHNKNIVMTMGEKGILWHTEHGKGSMPAFPVKAVDTTGAGDIFHGAFARCLALKLEWQQTLYFSSAAAALSCMKMGARTSIPSLAEVNAFLKSKGL